MNLERLKAETLAEHRATESVMPVMDPDLTRERYTQTLQKLYRVVGSWEQWACGHAPSDLREMVKERRRAGLLLQDLQGMGATPDETAKGFPGERILGASSDARGLRARFLGAMYVMEGSTLGGQYIARHVEKTLDLKPGEGDAYFRGYGERTGERWLQFKDLLSELPEGDSDTVIAAAKAMFEIFKEGLIA